MQKPLDPQNIFNPVVKLVDGVPFIYYADHFFNIGQASFSQVHSCYYRTDLLTMKARRISKQDFDNAKEFFNLKTGKRYFTIEPQQKPLTTPVYKAAYKSIKAGYKKLKDKQEKPVKAKTSTLYRCVISRNGKRLYYIYSDTYKKYIPIKRVELLKLL